MAPPILDLKGKRFGNLVVVDATSRRAANGNVVWSCYCSCGKRTEVAGGDLRRWKPHQILSCGCRQIEGQRNRATHGMTKTPEFKVWMAMWDRCTREKNPAYHRYGGRGIKVCRRWEKFASFLEDMGLRTSPKHEIDRLDNDKGYSPSNCDWRTKKQQALNRRSTRWIEFNGKRQSLTDWASEKNMSVPALASRIEKWGLRRALTTDKKKGP